MLGGGRIAWAVVSPTSAILARMAFFKRRLLRGTPGLAWPEDPNTGAKGTWMQPVGQESSLPSGFSEPA
jgi:hypothetical protein